MLEIKTSIITVSETGRHLSLGKESRTYDCLSRTGYIQNNERKFTGNSSFHIPKAKAEIKDWCNLIKREDCNDSFEVTQSI